MSEFSAEQQSALDVVLSILSSPSYQETRRTLAARAAAARPAAARPEPTRPALVAQADGSVQIMRIARRTDIPLSEKHVLVMWGLSTYQSSHLLGTTFVVNNSRQNVARDSEFKSALAEAAKLAERGGLDRVYVMDD